ncbi:unnamed protein product [Staurois parvus]|uniref:Uncharacterized protein n=1 Tax=Staurois parvus TaxID=386267 RepID=A0ABN9B0S0_9NEOB|nr:unnamed protein product [Staurois parvus]
MTDQCTGLLPIPCDCCDQSQQITWQLYTFHSHSLGTIELLSAIVHSDHMVQGFCE